MNMSTFLIRTHLNFPKLDQLLAVSMIAGAIMLKVDIFTAPSRETTRSNQGTVAANATINVTKYVDYKLFRKRPLFLLKTCTIIF